MVLLGRQGEPWPERRRKLRLRASRVKRSVPNPHTADPRSAESKPVPRDGRQEGGCGKSITMQENRTEVLETTKQGPETQAQRWAWVEASVWTERMLAALGNGVQGGKWFSLIDKVYRPTTLSAAWERVKANRGAAGVDGQSVAAFACHAERYLAELAAQLKEGRYVPQPVK